MGRGEKLARWYYRALLRAYPRAFRRDYGEEASAAFAALHADAAPRFHAALIATFAGLAFLLARVLTSLVFQVSVTDPLTFGVAAASLAATGLLACWVPARRAAATDPASTLRAQ